MNATLMIAKLIGPVMLVSGVALLVNKSLVREIFEDFIKSPALIYLAGVLALVMGIMVIVFHNIWVTDWPVLITVFGWLAALAGVVRMVFPASVKQMGAWMVDHTGLIQALAVLHILLGGFFTYQGFWA